MHMDGRTQEVMPQKLSPSRELSMLSSRHMQPEEATPNFAPDRNTAAYRCLSLKPYPLPSPFTRCSHAVECCRILPASSGQVALNISVCLFLGTCWATMCSCHEDSGETMCKNRKKGPFRAPTFFMMSRICVGLGDVLWFGETHASKSRAPRLCHKIWTTMVQQTRHMTC